MNAEQLIQGLGIIMWPTITIIIFINLRKELRRLLLNVQHFKGLGVELDTHVQQFGRQLGDFESITKKASDVSDRLYYLTGTSKQVRQEIWQYIANILDEEEKKVSDTTRFEMRRELNKYHIPRVYPHKKGVEEIKNMLEKIEKKDSDKPYYKRDENEKKYGLNSEINEELVASIVQFQKDNGCVLIDGIFGPETLARMEAEFKRKLEEKS